MSKASEIMERLDAIDPDEAIGDDKDMFYFRAVDALIKALTGNEIWWLGPLQDGIAEIREALREAFGELEARAMPEGCEWPRYEDGEPLEVEQTVHCTMNGDEPTIVGLNERTEIGRLARCDDGIFYVPVLDADGVPIKVHDTVYEAADPKGLPMKVSRFICKTSEIVVECRHTWRGYMCFSMMAPDQITHKMPEPPDSWESIEEDAELDPFDYCIKHRMADADASKKEDAIAMAHDIVRRCKKLAGAE